MVNKNFKLIEANSYGLNDCYCFITKNLNINFVEGYKNNIIENLRLKF